MRIVPAAALTALSAGLYAASFPPLRVRALAWIALVPFLVALRGASPRLGIGLGVLWSLTVGWGLGTWMPDAVSGFFQQPLWVGAALFLVVTGLMAAPYYTLFAVVYEPLVRAGGAAAPLLAGAAWAAAELMRGRLLNGLLMYVGNSPWGTLGYSQAGVGPVVQIASVAGVYGVSFVVAAVNAALAEVVTSRAAPARARAAAWRGVAAATSLVVAIIGFGLVTLRTVPASRTAPVPIALVQGDVDAAARWGAEGAARTLDAYQRLTADAFASGNPKIVLWPEAAVTFFLEQDRLYGPAVPAVLRGRDAELVIGAPRAGGPDGAGPYANSVYVLDPGGTITARYDKQYLLPFMEYFPLRIALAQRRFGRVREFTPGAPSAPLATRAGRAGMLVCNEAFLPHLAARRIAEGADYLVNPSNDSWVPNAGFAEQQFDIVSFRAVEQRSWLVRVSDSGPSGVIDPYGRVAARTKPLTRAVLTATIAPERPSSVYGRIGDLFGVVCALAVATALVVRRQQ